MVKTIEQEHISGSMYREVHRDVAKLRNEQLLDCYRWVVHYTLARSIKLFITDIGSNNGRIFIWSDRCTFLLWWKVFDNSDPVFLHSHLQDCFPPVHSQDWMGIPILPRSWPMISECSFQDLRILRNTVYRNREIQQWSSWNWSTKYITQSENSRSFNEITMMTKSWFASSHNWLQWSWAVSFLKQGQGWWWWWCHCGYHRY